MLALSIQKIKNKNSLIVQFLILVSAMIVLYLLLPTANRSLLLLPIIIFILYLVSKKERGEFIGKIYLSNHQIKVKTKTDNFLFDLNNLDKFELIYGGYVGQGLRKEIITSYFIYSGNANYLEIIKNNFVFKCRFLVENSKQENELIKLVENWETLGYNISNIKIDT